MKDNQVHYIGQRPKSWKETAITGLLFLGIAGTSIAGTYYFLNSKKSHSPSERIDKRVEYVYNEMKDNPEAFRRNYDKFADLVDDGFDDPKNANRFVQSGMKYLKPSELENKTWQCIIKPVTIKAEENPKVMECFLAGPKSRDYLENKFAPEYKEIIDKAFRDINKSLGSAKKRLKELGDETENSEWLNKYVRKPIADTYEKIRQKLKD